MSDETQQETVEGVITESPPVTENVSGQSDPALAESPPANPPVTEQPENKGSNRAFGQFRRGLRELREQQREQARQFAEIMQRFQQPAPQPSGDAPPKREEFQDYESFVRATSRWEAKQELREELARREQEYSRTQQESVRRESESATAAAREEFMSAGMEKYGEEFEEIVTSGSLAITDPMAAALQELEYGVDVAWHLSQHPKEAARISKLSPARQIAEIGKLEDKLLADQRAAPSAAPNPLKPVKTKQAPASDEITPDDDADAFYRKRNAQVKRKRGY